MKEEGWSVEDAIDWVEYNTVRSLPYMGHGAPVIQYPEDEPIELITKFI